MVETRAKMISLDAIKRELSNELKREAERLYREAYVAFNRNNIQEAVKKIKEAIELEKLSKELSV